jgi:hypothetical protein
MNHKLLEGLDLYKTPKVNVRATSVCSIRFAAVQLGHVSEQNRVSQRRECCRLALPEKYNIAL